MNSKVLKRVSFLTVCLLVALIGASSCNTSKRLAKGKSPDNKSPQYLMKRLSRAQFEFTWMTAKVTSKVKMKGKSFNFKSSIRMRHDSVIWVSMTPALGIEAARVKLTRDSVKFVNKIEKNYWVGTYAELNERMSADLDFEMIEDFIIGNALGFDFDEKYKSSVDTSDQYVLTTKGPRKLRKAVDPKNLRKEDKKESIESDTTMGLTIDDRKLQKALEKANEEHLVLMRYWLDPVSFNLGKVMINDLTANGVLEVNFEDFRELDEQVFPYRATLFLTNMTESLMVHLKYSKVRVNKPTTFPFKIQEKYEQIIY
jgi:hypothetical protein